MMDECRVGYDGGQFAITAVDARNVSMVDVTLDAGVTLDGAFEIGVDLGRLAGLLQNKPRKDDAVDVTLELCEPTSTLSVENEYANGRVWNLTETFELLNTDSVRQTPDIPSLETECVAELDVGMIANYLNTRQTDEPVELKGYDGGFRIAQRDESGDNQRYRNTMKTEDLDTGGNGVSVYSHIYLKQMFNAMNDIGVDTTQVQWTDEYPVGMEFESDAISGMYMLAPRLEK